MTQQIDRTNGNAPAIAGSESSASETDLDRLLSEFQEGTRPAPSAQAAFFKPIEPILRYVEEDRQAKAKTAFDADVAQAMDALTADSDDYKALPKRFVRGYLETYAIENPSFKEAFTNKREDPAGWQAALGKAKGEFQDEAKPFVSGRLKSDVEAANAAVAGQSSTRLSPDEIVSPAKIHAMTDQEFKAHKQRLLSLEA